MDFHKEALRILEDCTDAVLTSVSEDGFPRSCYLSIIGHDGFENIYFSTGTNGTKVRHFKSNNKASVCYSNGTDGITLVGTVEIVEVIETKKKYFHDWMLNYFKDGVADKEYCLLKFTAIEGTFWIDQEFLCNEKLG